MTKFHQEPKKTWNNLKLIPCEYNLYSTVNMLSHKTYNIISRLDTPAISVILLIEPLYNCANEIDLNYGNNLIIPIHTFLIKSAFIISALGVLTFCFQMFSKYVNKSGRV